MMALMRSSRAGDVAVRMRRDKRRQQILKAARKEFTKLGYRGTTSRRLAQAVGITEVMLFRYFPTKENLYSEVIEKYSGVAKTQEIAEKACQMKLEQGLQYLATEILSILRKQMPLIKMVLMEGKKNGKQARIAFRKEPQKCVAALERFFRVQRRRKAVRKVNIALTARAFLSMIFTFILLQEIFRVQEVKRRHSKAVVKAFVDIFIHGIVCEQKAGRRKRRRTARK
jgi:AcrR family transcriptional regulator